MGMILNALEGRGECITFLEHVRAVKERPNDTGAWVDLVNRIRHQAATGTTHRYAEIWHQVDF